MLNFNISFPSKFHTIYIYIYILMRNEEIYIKRRKDTRERRDTREREEKIEGWEVLPTKTKIEQKRKHPTLENEKQRTLSNFWSANCSLVEL